MFSNQIELFFSSPFGVCYSGDIDSVVPVTTTKKSVKGMQLPVKTPWRPWNCDQQVVYFLFNKKKTLLIRNSRVIERTFCL
jgi:Serine carboxypeptidase